MTLKILIGKVNSALEPYRTLLLAIGVICGAVISAYTFLFKPQDLSVFVEREEVDFPASINQRFSNVYNYLADHCKDTGVANDVQATMRYLQNTNNFWIITLRNETEKPIKTIRLRITDVMSLGAWSVNSDFLFEKEKKQLVNSFSFDSANSLVGINSIESLPGKHEIKLFLWGKLPVLRLDQNLLVEYDGGQGHIGHEYTATGFKAFLCSNLWEFYFLTLLIVGIGYWRLKQKYRYVATP